MADHWTTDHRTTDRRPPTEYETRTMATPSKADTDGESNATQSDRQPGPALLNDRPLLAIFVHLVALVASAFGFGFIVAAFVYSVSDHEYTRENARHALNWHLFVTAYFTGLVVAALLVIGVGNLVSPPDLIMLVPLLVVVVGIGVAVLLTFATVAFALVATVKAIFGDAWTYPIAPELV